MAQTNAAHPESNEESSGSPGNKPVEKFNDGPVHVSIWENSGPQAAFRTASFQLRYRDQNNEWHTGQSFGLADLKHLENAAKEARTRIENWKQANKASHTPKSAA